MQFEVKIDETVTEPKVLILTDKITNEVNDLVRKLAENERQIIVVVYGESSEAEKATFRSMAERNAVITFCNYTQKELSDESGKSPAAICQKIKTIRKKLKKSE